jgi:hypothetical protein
MKVVVPGKTGVLLDMGGTDGATLPEEVPGLFGEVMLTPRFEDVGNEDVPGSLEVVVCTSFNETCVDWVSGLFSIVLIRSVIEDDVMMDVVPGIVNILLDSENGDAEVLTILVPVSYRVVELKLRLEEVGIPWLLAIDEDTLLIADWDL